MNKRFTERRAALLAECEVPPTFFSKVLERLEVFSEPFVSCLDRREQREHAQTYFSGLLSDLQRKNTESIAYRNDQDRRALQRFIGESTWDHHPLLSELARQIGVEIGEADGVIVFDPSGFKKYGKDSVGVARQWLGRLGKVDNGQVAVYMGYASREEHALVNARLFLPREWIRDRCRRAKCHVPKGTRFKTRHEMALEMLEECGRHLPHQWISGDDEMGRSTAFRRALRARNERYMLAIPSNSSVRDVQAVRPAYQGHGAPPKQPFQNVMRWRKNKKPSDWTRIDVRDGEKGPLIVDALKTRVQARTERGRDKGTEELLVVIRSRDEHKKWKYDYYMSNADPDTPLKELARVAKAEHRIEDCIKRGKSESGLADYEMRTWEGWHHHQTLSLIACWFLVREARRGKKEDSCPDGSPSSRRTGEAAA